MRPGTRNKPASGIRVDREGRRREKTVCLAPQQFRKTRFGIGKCQLKIVLKGSAVPVEPLYVDQKCASGHAGQFAANLLEGLRHDAKIATGPVLKKLKRLRIKVRSKLRIAQ